jgi:hypothetical protein
MTLDAKGPAMRDRCNFAKETMSKLATIEFPLGIGL